MEILKNFVAPEIYGDLMQVVRPRIINTFDCARFSMGVAQIALARVTFLPRVRTCTYSLADRITILEAHLEHVARMIDALLQIRYIAVWRLGQNDAALHDAWDVAPPLRERLEKMDRKYGAPDVLIYEFQMSANDKSRMISAMLAYHYSGKKTVRIAPAAKNTIKLAECTREEFMRACPRVSTRRIRLATLTTVAAAIFDGVEKKPLNIQTFLAISTDTYKANKLHTSACLEWWAYHFGVDLCWVPRECLDDAADAFMQTVAAIARNLI